MKFITIINIFSFNNKFIHSILTKTTRKFSFPTIYHKQTQILLSLLTIQYHKNILNPMMMRKKRGPLKNIKEKNLLLIHIENNMNEIN